MMNNVSAVNEAQSGICRSVKNRQESEVWLQLLRAVFRFRSGGEISQCRRQKYCMMFFRCLGDLNNSWRLWQPSWVTVIRTEPSRTCVSRCVNSVWYLMRMLRSHSMRSRAWIINTVCLFFNTFVFVRRFKNLVIQIGHTPSSPLSNDYVEVEFQYYSSQWLVLLIIGNFWRK